MVRLLTLVMIGLIWISTPVRSQDLFLYRSGADFLRVGNGIKVDGTVRRVPFILLIRPKDGARIPLDRCGAAVIDPLVSDDGVEWRGGSVSSPKWAITAAHCLVDAADRPIDPKKMFVIGGQLGLDPTKGITADVKEIIFHPDGFSRSQNVVRADGSTRVAGENDIALLLLENVVTQAEGLVVRSIKPDATHGALVAPYTSLFVAGWGRDAVGAHSEVLFEAQLPAVERETCLDALKVASSVDQSPYQLRDTMICAGFGSGGYDACMGDSGGPLFYRPPASGVGRWGEPMLAGIVSWSPKSCARVGQFGIYTYIEPYREWLEQEVQKY